MPLRRTLAGGASQGAAPPVFLSSTHCKDAGGRATPSLEGQRRYHQLEEKFVRLTGKKILITQSDAYMGPAIQPF